MQIEIKIDTGCAETKVIIVTGAMTDEISELAKKISEHTPSVLAGFRDDDVSILDFGKIIRFYTANQKVYAVTKTGESTARLVRLPFGDSNGLCNNHRYISGSG